MFMNMILYMIYDAMEKFEMRCISNMHLVYEMEKGKILLLV